MKVSFNKQILHVVKKIQNKVDKMTQEALNRVVNNSTILAQEYFDRFYYEVPADDPFVFVSNTPMLQVGKTTWSRQINCVGNQVLFIEFGAGQYFYTGDLEARLYAKYLGNLATRPPMISDIGTYGSGRGKDDVWLYKSKTGRESNNASLYRYNKNNEPIMITHGNRPARALYRGVGMALRRLAEGKLK